MSGNSLNSESSIQQSSKMPLSSKEATSLITEKAKQLVNQLVEYRGHDRPPFLPEDYSRLVNIKEIQKTELGDTSGLLLKFHDGYVIKLNKDHYQVRQNFSCAHEIGHILFDELQLDNYVRNIEYRTFIPSKTTELRSRARETLCDVAAAELLMPELVFRKYLSTFGLSITSVEHLASAFKVSIQAAVRRIAEVSVEPCVTVLWQPWPKIKPTELRPVMGNQSNGNVKYFDTKQKQLVLVLAGKTKNISGVEVIDDYNLKGTIVFKPVSVTSVLFKAYQGDSLVKTWKLFKDDNTEKRLPIEAKGFGYGETRYVISLVFPDR